MQKGDVFIVLFILLIIIMWGWVGFNRWLGTTRPPRRPSALRESARVHHAFPNDETVQLLESFEYEVISGKKRVPITMVIDEEKELQSRLFIDYFARDKEDGSLYAVKVANERKPLNMTGSAVREALLPYYLLYDDVSGVLYVDLKQRSVKQILFEIED